MNQQQLGLHSVLSLPGIGLALERPLVCVQSCPLLPFRLENFCFLALWMISASGRMNSAIFSGA